MINLPKKWILSLILIMMCTTSINANAGAAIAQAKVVQSQPKVTIAEPKQYNPIMADKLGVNENNKGLMVGGSVREFTVNDIRGNPYAIKNAWRDQPALIIFYRGGWCPYCNMQVRELSVNFDKLQAAGVQPVLISVDDPEKTAMISAKYTIPFPVLSDPSLVAHNAFNVVIKPDEAVLEKYKEYGINLQDWSGKDHNSFAVASVFLIDQRGRVLISHAPTDYTARPSIEQLLAMIKARSGDARQ